MEAAIRFGNLLRDLRISTNQRKLRVPEICEQVSCARSRWYRWEKGQETPMKQAVLDRIAAFFKLKEHTDLWYELFNYAYLAHYSIPPYLRNDVLLLHTVFINLYTVKPTVDEFSDAMAFIQRQRTSTTKG